MANFSSNTTAQDNVTFNPFQNFDFSKFHNFSSFDTAREKFSADNFFDTEAKTFEFVFFSPFSFSEFTTFFAEEIAPKLKKSSFIKFNFFFSEINSQFKFAEFSDFFSQFLKDGIFLEFSFFPITSNSINFEDFNFSDFEFPFDFTSGDFKFSVRQATIR